ncbi:MAG: S-layer protein [Haloquadratum sp.]
MKRKALATLLVVSLLASAVPVAGLTSAPELRTVTSNPTLQPGGINEVSFQLVNDASGPEDEIRTATNIHVRLGGSSRFDVQTRHLYVPKLTDGEPVSLTAVLDVPANVSSGTYRIPLYLTYEYEQGSGNEVERQATASLTVRVKPGPRFAVVDTNSTATVDGSGTLEVTMRNVGDTAALDSRLTLSSSSPEVGLGAGSSSTRFVDSWATGETRTFEFETSLGANARPGTYSLDATVAFEKPDGTQGTSATLAVPLRALPEVTFAVSEVQSTLQVGTEGTVSGTVTNTGPMRVTDAVVTFADPGPTVTPVETSVAIGALDPGQSASFSFDVEVTSSAEAGARQFDLGVSYYDGEGDLRKSEALPVQVVVDEQSPEFDVAPVDATLSAGSSGQLRVRVTNTRDTAVTDISAKVYLDSPLSSSNDEAFIERLEPGHSKTVVFQLSAGGGAIAKTYPVKMDFQYDDSEGETIISDTYQLPVRVTAPADSGPPIVPIAVVAAAILVGGGYLYYRRRA